MNHSRMMTAGEFTKVFHRLTGHAPLSWQTRLFDDHFAKGQLPSTIDLPTGLGKTMVIAIWMIAREFNKHLPRRLVYVVDRRTVVDQATDLAMKLKIESETDGGTFLAVSALRGQLADNREWSADPSRPALIIGTVDLIGSALLYSGYRSSFRRRSLEGGLLGCDSLVVLDEAHLSKPFEKLLRSIGSFNRLHAGADPPIQPTRVICMSATSNEETQPQTFRLDTDWRSASCDLVSQLDENGNEQNAVKLRFEAKKTLTIHTVGEKKSTIDGLAETAISLASNGLSGSRFVIFVRKPDDARKIAETIRKHTVETIDTTGTKPKKIKATPYETSVEVLTGAMRGLERDNFVGKPVVKRFLDGDEKPSVEQSPVFLVSTSAGEVGFDLNADHMVCDATSLDSVIQRLGRVNRRGHGDASVVLVRDQELSDKTDFDKACKATVELLTDGMSLSPAAIADWKAGLTAEQLKAANSPEPATVELTDILLDAWSMTSITDRMPGRPEVGPWLRGLDEEQAQTTVAWRAELELLREHDSPQKALAAIFTRHRIRPHESLAVNTHYLVSEFLKKLPKPKDGSTDLHATRVAVRMPRGEVICRTIDQLVNDPSILYANSTLILPATFGGLDTNSGMLDAGTVLTTHDDEDSETRSLDIADHKDYEQPGASRSRLRVVLARSEDGWTAHSLSGAQPIPDDIAPRLDDMTFEKTAPIFTMLKDAGFRVRLVQTVEVDAEGDPVRQLVAIGPAPKDRKQEDESLHDHVSEVECHAKRIADNLDLSGAIRDALLFAARWHDEGKKADIWQFFAKGPMEDDQPKGKTADSRSPQTLKGYRHEFGSLLRLLHPDRREKIDATLPEDETTRDLALHLIATHHGWGRPHFRPAVYDDFTDNECDAVHSECLRRFARLQRRYGWWTLAWLENLLRCADQLASADEESTTIDEQESNE